MNKVIRLLIVLAMMVGAFLVASAPAVADPDPPAEVWVCPSGDCGHPGAEYATIQEGVAAVASGGTVHVMAGTYVLASTVNVNKAVLIDGEGTATTVVEVSYPEVNYAFYITASGATLQNLQIKKTDKDGPQNLIYIGASNVTVKDNLIWGQYVLGDPDVSRAFEVAYGSANLLIQGNTIHSLRQPGYFNGSVASPTTGNITGNYVYGTRGWVMAGANITFTDNTWGTDAQANYLDIAILAGTDPGYYPDIVAISEANNNAVVEDQRPSPAVLSDVFVDDDAAAGGDGTVTKPYQTISPAIARAVAGGTIYVAAGTYHERLTVGKSLTLRGVQYGVDPTPLGARTNPANESVIDLEGVPLVNPNILIEIPCGVSDVTIDGFTLIGSPTFHWADESVVRCCGNNIALRNNIVSGYYGLHYRGTGNGLTCSANRITANKTGITVQFGANAASFSGNKITPGSSPASDASAIYLTGCVDCSVTGNTGTGFTGNNGVGGSNHTRLTISENTFTGNKKGVNIWGNTTFVTIINNALSDNVQYGINIKGQDIYIAENSITNNGEAGVALDKHVIDTQRVTIYNNDLSGNATYAITSTTAVADVVNASGNWFGTNTPTGVKAQIGGNVDYTPWLDTGTDTSTDPGFQGDFSTLWVDDDSPQTGTTGRIQEGVDLVTGSTVNIADGTYTANSLRSIVVSKDNVSLMGQSRDGTIIDAGAWGTSPAGWPAGVHVKANNVAIKNLTVQGFTGDGVSTGGYGIVFRDWDHDTPGEGYIYYSGGRVENVKVQNCYSSIYALVQRNLTVHNCLVKDSLADGMFIARESDNATITDNTVLNSGNQGIWVGICWMGLGPSDNAVITGNTVDGAVEGGISFVKSDGAIISGNDVSHAKGGGWSKGAISLKDGVSNVTVSNNVVHDNSGSGCPSGFEPCTGRGIGIDGTSTNVTLSGNLIVNNAGGGIKVEGTATGFGAYNNVIMGNTGYGAEATTAAWLDFTDNYWGHRSGPADIDGTNECLPCNSDPALDKNADGTGDAVSGKVDYCPWREGVPPAVDLQAVLDASCSKTVYLGPHTYKGGITIGCDLTLQGVPGTVIGPGSHGITVSADDVTIEGITLDGSGGDPGDCGIYVNAGVQRLWVRECEVRNWPADGMYFAGAVSGLKVVDNYIHENGSDGIEFTQAPGGSVYIYGNAFRANTAYGINAVSGSVTAEYNEWGDIAGPTGTNGDGVSGTVDYDPWVFGRLYVDAPATVREGENFTVYLKTDAHHLYGVQFDLTFEPAKLQVVSLTDGDFKASGDSVKTYDNGAGTLHYHYSRQAPDAEYDATGGVILEITFQAQDISGSSESTTIDLDADSVMLGAKGGINIYVDSVTDDSVLILGTTTVSGVVDLQGRDNDSGAVVDPEAGQTYGYDPAPYITGAWGTYSFANMTDDTYKFTVEMARYLDAWKDVVVGGETLDLGTVKLLGGDANDDDIIDISDLTIIGGQFGKSGGGITDPRADINADNMVDILDLVLAAGNYYLSSPVPWA